MEAERGPLDDVFRDALEDLDLVANALDVLRARIQKVRAVMPGYHALNPEATDAEA